MPQRLKQSRVLPLAVGCAISVLPAFLCGCESKTDRAAREDKTDSKKREAEAYRKQGFDHSEAGRYEEAIIAYKKYIALKPDDALAYHNMGNACQSLK